MEFERSYWGWGKPHDVVAAYFYIILQRDSSYMQTGHFAGTVLVAQVLDGLKIQDTAPLGKLCDTFGMI